MKNSFPTKLQIHSPQISRSHVYFVKGVKPSFTKYTLARNDRFFDRLLGAAFRLPHFIFT